MFASFLAFTLALYGAPPSRTVEPVRIAQSYGQGFGFVAMDPQPCGAYPTIRAFGTKASTITTITPGIPTGTATGDLLLMFLETQAGETSTATGWTQAFTSESGSGATGTKVTVLYKTAESSTPTRTTNDPGDHIGGVIAAITAGTWANFSSSSASNSSARSSGTSIDFPAMPLTRRGCLVFQVTGGADDNNRSGIISGWAYNTVPVPYGNPTLLGENADNGTQSGNGGLLAIASFTACQQAIITGTATSTTSEVGAALHFEVCPP